MRGDSALAERCIDEADATLHELGSLTSSVSHQEAEVLMLAGRPEARRPGCAPACERLAR